MSEQHAEDVVDEVESDEVEYEEVPMSPKLAAIMTITMFVGFVAFVAVCLPMFFFN